MPRRPRVSVDGAVYHVTCRMTRGERIFAGPRAVRAFVAVLRGVAQRGGLTILAWSAAVSGARYAASGIVSLLDNSSTKCVPGTDTKLTAK
jgi:hypothetical protein